MLLHLPWLPLPSAHSVGSCLTWPLSTSPKQPEAPMASIAGCAPSSPFLYLTTVGDTSTEKPPLTSS